MALRDDFDEHLAVATASAALLPGLERAAELVADAIAAGGAVLSFGNGGSAADAQHLASELVGHFEGPREPWRAQALTVDPSTMTSLANDFGFEQVYARQVRAHARPGDVVVAISTSGTSPNVVAGAVEARSVGCRVVALTGAGGGELGRHADVLLAVPSTRVARIQEVHLLCLHLLVAELEARRRPDGSPAA